MRRTHIPLILLLAASFAGPGWAGDDTVDLRLGTRTFSCDARGARLKVILERLQKEKKIWFKGDQSVCEQEVTAKFTDLAYPEGVTKILSGCNYSLVFDDRLNLTGVILFGRPEASQPRSTRTSRPPKKPPAKRVIKPKRKSATVSKSPPPKKAAPKPE
jgi:hypothetical protein